MKKLLLVPLLAMLAACSIPAVTLGTPVQSPAPLAKTTIDDVALRDAWLAYEAAIDAIQIARQAGAPSLKAGTPKAIRIANANDKVLAAFQAAERVAAGLSTTEPLTALAELRAALVEFRTAIGSN